MTPKPELEIKGTFLTHPLAEILAECAAARLSGSIRITERDKKCIIYLKAGHAIFAVSNARSSRLFDVLLRANKLTKEELAKIPNFGNDLELTAHLQAKGLLTKEESDRMFQAQIEGIIIGALSWASSDWVFSPLARARDGLAFKINTPSLLLQYGRSLSLESVLTRFRSLDERFSKSNADEIQAGLSPAEAFVLSRADDGPLTAAGLVSIAGMKEEVALRTVYTLWLGGLLDRHDWQPAFTEETIAVFKSVRLELKREARMPGEAETHEKKETPDERPAEPITSPAEKEISVEEYLERVEGAETYYDVLGVETEADTNTLKKAYFSLARMFHPDRYHAEGGETFRRIQKAFTELAQAHETLKTKETREVYDYRMRKELADRERQRSAGGAGSDGLQKQQAAENFDRGFSMMTAEDDAEAASEFFARAAHLDPQNARYHAYYGKALTSDPDHRYKAESELQAAIKLDPNNAAYRLWLAEFFIRYKLLKRAEGELNRLLAIFPDNTEARSALKSLGK